MSTSTKRPPKEEYAPFYSGYIAEVPDGEIVTLMDDQAREFARLPSTVSPASEEFAYAPGKWTVRQVVGHLGDAERVFGYRALCISRGDTTPLPGFDENEYVARATSARRPLRELVEDLTLLRGANRHLFASLDAPDWLRVGTANDHPVSVRALAFILVGHAQHHLRVLRGRYGIRS